MYNNKSNKKSFIITLIVLILVIAASTIIYQNLAQNTNTELAALDKDNQNTTTDETTSAETSPEKESASQPDNSSDDETTTPIRQLAPDFTVEDIDGNKYKLSDFRGKPVIVNFWASWCGPCKMEMPDFEELFKEYGGKINFLMVNMTDGFKETKEDALRHISSEGYTFPVYFDTDSEAAYAYRVSSIPATYFIDSEGYPIVYGVGALNKATLLQGIGMLPEFAE